MPKSNAKKNQAAESQSTDETSQESVSDASENPSVLPKRDEAVENGTSAVVSDDIHQTTDEKPSEESNKDRQNDHDHTETDAQPSTTDKSSSTTKADVEKAKPKPTKKRPKRPSLSHKITEYFSVRRSERKPEKLIQAEKQSELHTAILREDEFGLEITESPTKGRGIMSARTFERHEFVVEYRGDLISPKAAKQREKQYADDSRVGCYMYYFECNGKRWCVDATAESKYLGRLINHSSKRPNLYTKAIPINGQPHLVLMAARKIEVGEELLYNYGERSKDILDANPWLVET